MAAIPFRDNPQQMETLCEDDSGSVHALKVAKCTLCQDVLYSGAGLGPRTQLITSYTGPSLYVSLLFPALFDTVPNQGGSQAVLICLACFRYPTKCRVSCGLGKCRIRRVLMDRSSLG
jgi:hypothetical protein